MLNNNQALWACSQTLAGPQAAGRWTGLQNGVGNLGGVIGPRWQTRGDVLEDGMLESWNSTEMLPTRRLIGIEMVTQLTLPKINPVDVVRRVFSAIEAGREEVLADEIARQVKAGLSTEPGIYLNFKPRRDLENSD